MTMMEEIEQNLHEGGQWCSIEKARWLAEHVVREGPELAVEIGVWMGGSLIPILIAMRESGRGKAIAIDPWDRGESAAGQTPNNAHWWGNVDHDNAFDWFCHRLRKHSVQHLCEIWRSASNNVTPPPSIGLLHIDGNHGEQAERDAERFIPHMAPKSFVIIDDVEWEGGHVSRAVEIARSHGFVDVCPLGTGLVLQRS